MRMRRAAFVCGGAPAMLLAFAGNGLAAVEWRVQPAHNWPGPGDTLWAHGGGGPMQLLNTSTLRAWEWDGTRWLEKGPATFTPSTFRPRSDVAVAYDSTRGRTVVFGGQSYAFGDLNETWEFDGTTWTPGATAPPALTARRGSGLAYDSVRQRMVLYGGGFGGPMQFINETWEYDGTTWTQIAVAQPLPARREFTLTYHAGRGKTVMFGGTRPNTTPSPEVWEYDGTAWTRIADAPFSRKLHRAAYDEARNLLVVAGGIGPGQTIVTDAWTLSTAGTWTQVSGGPQPEPRYWPAMAYDAARQVVLFHGGIHQESNGPTLPWSSSTWELSASGWRQGHAGFPHMERAEHGMVYDAARDRVVVFGGFNTTTYLERNDTWEYDGFLWIPGGPAPPALTSRAGAVMAYDSTRARTVLFGGDGPGGGVHNDTWTYDGAWSQATPALSPPRRAFGAMVYDAGRDRMVTFGGWTGSAGTRFADTWEYDGTTWTDRSPATGPPARDSQAMAYDSRRQRTVMFGGWDAAAAYNDTWEWDGSQWTAGPAPPNGLSRRGKTRMVFDPDRGVALLTGGLTGANVRQDDAWEYNGVTWTGAPSMSQPRWQHAMVYDTLRDRAIVFGGRNIYDQTTSETFQYCSLCTMDIVAGEGHGPANPNRVRVHDRNGVFANVDFLAYGAGQQGVNVGSAEINGPSGGEILTGPGPGAVFGPQVRAWDRTGVAVAKVNFYAYGTLKYGANVGNGELDRDSFHEILSGAGPGAVFGPHVRGFNYDGTALAALAKVNFFAYGTLKYGVNIEGADVEADGYAEVLTAPGPGAIFGPQVRGFDYDNAALTSIAKINFNAFATPQFGANLAAGDVDADMYSEIVASPGPGGSASFTAHFLGFDFDGSAILANGIDVTLLAGGNYGGRAGTGDLVGEGRDQLLAGAGPDQTAQSTVQVFRYFSTTLSPGVAFVPFTDLYGVDPAGGALGY